MLSVLFWNLNRKPIDGLVTGAAADNNSDVLILAECRNPVKILERLNSGTTRYFTHLQSLDETFQVFYRLPVGSLIEEASYNRLTFFKLVPPVGIEVLLVAAHLPSKLFRTDDDLAFLSRLNNKKIVEIEEKVGHKRTVVIGDLNMNPYEPGLVGADGFNATPARSIAGRGNRTSGGEQYDYFYNPMWNHFGDNNGPPGTFYYGSPSPTEGHWHMLDQILVRPALLDAFPKDSAHIITQIEETNLVRSDGRIDVDIGSDHLPISFQLDLLKE